MPKLSKRKQHLQRLEELRQQRHAPLANNDDSEDEDVILSSEDEIDPG